MCTQSKTRGWIAAALILTVASGCATHEQTVKTQGTAGGAALGAAIGYLLGGKNGAAWGAALGAGTGYLVGSQVASRQQKYASREEMIEGETSHTEQLIAEVQGINAGLDRDIVALNGEIAALQTKAARGTATRQEKELLRAKTRRQLESARRALATVEQERDIAVATLEGERRKGGGDWSRLALWQSKVEQLDRERQELERYVGELAAMDDSIPL